MNKKYLPRLFPFFLDDIEKDWDLDVREKSDVTISEDKSNFYVEANLPGMKIEDIDVSLDGDILKISAEKKEEKKDKKYYRKAKSSFFYRVALPGTLSKAKDIDAVYEDGVMKLTFPKEKKSIPQKIKIKKRK